MAAGRCTVGVGGVPPKARGKVHDLRIGILVSPAVVGITAGAADIMAVGTSGKSCMLRMAAHCIGVDGAVWFTGATGCTVTAAATDAGSCGIALGVAGLTIGRCACGWVGSSGIAVGMTTDAAGTAGVSGACCIVRHGMPATLEAGRVGVTGKAKLVVVVGLVRGVGTVTMEHGLPVADLANVGGAARTVTGVSTIVVTEHAVQGVGGRGHPGKHDVAVAVRGGNGSSYDFYIAGVLGVAGGAGEGRAPVGSVPFCVCRIDVGGVMHERAGCSNCASLAGIGVGDIPIGILDPGVQCFCPG